MTAFDRLTDQLMAALNIHLETSKGTAVPEAGRLLWSWFCDLCGTRSYHEAGPNPLSYAEIHAWARLHRWPIEERHVNALMAMDRAFLDHAHAKQQHVDPMRATVRFSSGQAINPAAFDAVFH